MNISDARQKLSEILHQIKSNQFSHGLRGVQLWSGAGVIIRAFPVKYDTSKVVVTTRHAKMLSWLFTELRNCLRWTYDYQTKYEFFGGLATAAIRHQYYNMNSAERSRLSEQDRLKITDFLVGQPGSFGQPIGSCCNGFQVDCRPGDETNSHGLLTAVLQEAQQWLEAHELYPRINIFVYGTLMAGEANHHLMNNVLFLGEDAINHSQLLNTGAYPVLLPGNSIVYGERYRVPKATLLHLDYLEGHPYLFHRSWMQLTSSDWAWVYQGKQQIAEGCPCIQSGRWRDRFEGANAEASSVTH